MNFFGEGDPKTIRKKGRVAVNFEIQASVSSYEYNESGVTICGKTPGPNLKDIPGSLSKTSYIRETSSLGCLISRITNKNTLTKGFSVLTIGVGSFISLNLWYELAPTNQKETKQTLQQRKLCKKCVLTPSTMNEVC
jgi:hypothetical protein